MTSTIVGCERLIAPVHHDAARGASALEFTAHPLFERMMARSVAGQGRTRSNGKSIEGNAFSAQ
jgi:hypothetical protein